MAADGRQGKIIEMLDATDVHDVIIDDGGTSRRSATTLRTTDEIPEQRLGGSDRRWRGSETWNVVMSW